MYTECPDCRTAFRLNARILKQAHGRVRCGGCGSTFNAIDHLSEDLPDDKTGNTTTAHIFDERSRKLLESLDQLTGPGELRIEDTGVEWRVLDVDDDAESGAPSAENDPLPDSSPTGTIQWSLEEADTPETDAGADVNAAREQTDYPPVQADRRRAAPSLFSDDHGADNEDAAWQLTDDVAAETAVQPAAAGVDPVDSAADAVDAAELSDDAEETASPAATEATAEAAPDAGPPARATGNEVRYDDNTPLPDEFFRPYDEFLKTRPADAQSPARDGTSDAATIETPADGQADLEFGEADDWQDLLAEVGVEDDVAEAGRTTTPAADPPPAMDDNADTAAQAPGKETPDAGQAAATGGAGLLDRALAAASHIAKEVTGAHKQAAIAPDDDTAVHDLAADAASDDAPDEVDADAVAAQLADGTTEATAGADPEPQGIATADIEPEAEDLVAADATPEPAPEESVAAEVPPVPASGESIAAEPASTAIDPELLVEMEIDQELLRAAAEQAEEAARDKPANRPAAGDSMLVETIIMEGDTVTDLLMEADAAESSDILPADALDAPANESGDTAMPYPLVYVSLTDRFEEMVGSRVLQPGEYLPTGNGRRRPVLAGANFTAVINIDTPSPDATGFKLNVCYRAAAGQLRCAIEDFKN